MNRREIDSEIQQKNYEQELLLCQKAGGDIFSFGGGNGAAASRCNSARYNKGYGRESPD